MSGPTHGWPESLGAAWCAGCQRVKYPLDLTEDGRALCPRCAERERQDQVQAVVCAGCGYLTRDRFESTLPGLRCQRCVRDTPTIRS